ncbi:DUF2927 domain-containing protein [Pedobacter frigiditerrae]|uniref:DUF2927 domain-containing protein n=1 Tax=Pedobacter frigiditerrae TaxID=2530452 RepID=A0A4R0N3Q5_9SPHI|nr:DUF2927 domain-containing protein [Pedobacter frigiditerrae]TCC93987.1 DUF2927 domain-containing protein [Pedobacter frigiditerrae]
MTLKLKSIILLLIAIGTDTYAQKLTSEEKFIFNEVAFTRKQAGDYELIHKWVAPIKYKVYGNADNYILKEIDSTFSQVKRLTNLDISKTTNDDEVNYIIVVGKKEVDQARLSKGFQKYLNGYGATLFRSNNKSEITKAETLLLDDNYTDKAAVKSSVIKNIVKSLGFFQKTKILTTSVFYEKNNRITKIDAFDSHIISKLYSPLIKPGMDKDQVAEINP